MGPRSGAVAGWSELKRHIWHEEPQAASVPVSRTLNASMIGPVIALFGMQEQKEEFLPEAADVDIWWGQAFSLARCRPDGST